MRWVSKELDVSYIISDGTFSLWLPSKATGYELTDNIEQAKQFISLGNAERVFKKYKKKYKKLDLAIKSVSISVDGAENSCDTVEDDVCEEIVDVIDTDVDCDNMIADIYEQADIISKMAKQAVLRKQELNSELSIADLEIQDIQHAAEFYELNAAQGYKIYKLLHDVRIRRRKIKNELAVIDSFLSASINSDRMEHVKNNINGLSNRTYTPRVNKELFGV